MKIYHWPAQKIAGYAALYIIIEQVYTTLHQTATFDMARLSIGSLEGN